jgi:hypothetical protein
VTPCRALVQAWLKALHILLDIETWYNIKIKKVKKRVSQPMCFILSTERNKIRYDYPLKILYKCSCTEFKIFFKKALKIYLIFVIVFLTNKNFYIKKSIIPLDNKIKLIEQCLFCLARLKREPVLGNRENPEAKSKVPDWRIKSTLV